MRTGTIGAETSARSAIALDGLLLAAFSGCSGDRIIRLPLGDKMLRFLIEDSRHVFLLPFLGAGHSVLSDPVLTYLPAR
jgi:hypothetical protein